MKTDSGSRFLKCYMTGTVANICISIATTFIYLFIYLLFIAIYQPTKMNLK